MATTETYISFFKIELFFSSYKNSNSKKIFICNNTDRIID